MGHLVFGPDPRGVEFAIDSRLDPPIMESWPRMSRINSYNDLLS